MGNKLRKKDINRKNRIKNIMQFIKILIISNLISFTFFSLCLFLIKFLSFQFVGLLFLSIASIIFYNFLFVLFFFRIQYKKINLTIELLQNISKKEVDLTKRIKYANNDDIGIINKTINIFISKIHDIIFKLKNIVKEIVLNSSNLTTAVNEILAAIEEMYANVQSIQTKSINLDQNINNSKNAITEINSAITNIDEGIEINSNFVYQTSSLGNQLIESIKNITDKIMNISTHTKSLSDEGQKGYSNMSEALAAIKNIENSKDKIMEILYSVNDIAEKTNILAINASIEAANAGVKGSGFSIISGEIRQLAKNAKQQVNSIKATLDKIVIDINKTTNLTETSSAFFNNTIKGITNISKIMEESVLQLRDMSDGTSKIKSTISNLIDKTNLLKKSSKNIISMTDIIDKSMIYIKNMSAENQDALNEMLIGFKEINSGINSIHDLGNTNYEIVNIIRNESDKFNIIDTSELKSTDGQQLVLWNIKEKKIKERPVNPLEFPEDDERHWYDMEFAGWNIDKINIPESPCNGTYGKKVICMLPGPHPYYNAYMKGMKRISEMYYIDLKIIVGNWTNEKENEHVAKIISEKPDLAIMSPFEIDRCTDLFKKINTAGIPVIASTTCPKSDGFKYILGFTGFDDWGTHRALAEQAARDFNETGNYCILGHQAGTPQYYARVYAVMTELNKIAPNMKCMDIKSSKLNRELSKNIVNDWIDKYQDQVNFIVCGDSGEPVLGMMDSFEEKGVNGIKLYVTGNNKLTLNLMKEGKIEAIRWESAESDGALAINMAIDWFNGLDFVPIQYLPAIIITKDKVDQYFPAQW